MARRLESYTHAELQELASFAGTPEGQSILYKFLSDQIIAATFPEAEFVPTWELPTPDRYYNIRVIRPAEYAID
ncbi:MAG TPA: hypothetical protein VLG13_01190 [Patescibacteria group bacterium]|nr:hypothetical protein [Patescibacteria group bacterium]